MHEKEHSRKPLALLGFYLRGHERTLFGALLFALVMSNLPDDRSPHPCATFWINTYCVEAIFAETGFFSASFSGCR